jgi:hypothetical protein
MAYLLLGIREAESRKQKSPMTDDANTFACVSVHSGPLSPLFDHESSSVSSQLQGAVKKPAESFQLALTDWLRGSWSVITFTFLGPGVPNSEPCTMQLAMRLANHGVGSIGLDWIG